MGVSKLDALEKIQRLDPKGAKISLQAANAKFVFPRDSGDDKWLVPVRWTNANMPWDPFMLAEMSIDMPTTFVTSPDASFIGVTISRIQRTSPLAPSFR